MKNITISYQDNFWSPLEFKLLGQILCDIRSDKYKNITIQLRNHYQNDDGLYSIKKRSLPAVTFCANFKNNARTKENLNTYNSLMILDIDNIGLEHIDSLFNLLSNDEYIFSLWRSPSGNGIKGIVKLNYHEELRSDTVNVWHYSAFAKLFSYFKDKYDIELDQSGKDFTRLCFLSWDENIHIKDFDRTKAFLTEREDLLEIGKIDKLAQNAGAKQKTIQKARDILNNPQGRNNASNKKTMQNIIKFLTKQKKSITFEYDNWLRVALGISSSFTFDIGLKYFIELSKMDSSKFNEIQAKNMLQQCYFNNKGQISFKTIIHLATQQGFKYGKDIGVESN